MASKIEDVPTGELVRRYVSLRFKEMADRTRKGKDAAARREIQIASTLSHRRGGVRALEAGLAAARLKS